MIRGGRSRAKQCLCLILVWLFPKVLMEVDERGLAAVTVIKQPLDSPAAMAWYDLDLANTDDDDMTCAECTIETIHPGVKPLGRAHSIDIQGAAPSILSTIEPTRLAEMRVSQTDMASVVIPLRAADTELSPIEFLQAGLSKMDPEKLLLGSHFVAKLNHPQDNWQSPQLTAAVEPQAHHAPEPQAHHAPGPQAHYALGDPSHRIVLPMQLKPTTEEDLGHGEWGGGPHLSDRGLRRWVLTANDMVPTHVQSAAAAGRYAELFPQSSFHSLQDLLGLRATAAVTYGYVSRDDGAPLAQAVVEVASDEQTEVVYFSGPLPDRKLRETSANGRFLVYQDRMKTPSTWSLRVRYQDWQYPAAWLDVAQATLSQMNFRLSSVENRLVKLAQIATNARIDGEMFVHGQDRPLAIHGEAEIDWIANGQYSVVEAFSPGFLPVRHQVAPDVNDFTVELWSQQQLDLLLKKKLVAAETALVFGKVRGSRFVVADRVIDPNVGVLFFSANGELSEQSYGEDGDYFLLQLEPGVHRIEVVSLDQLDQTYAEWVVVDSEITNYLSIEFRN